MAAPTKTTQAPPKETGMGIVKAVNSGDTLILFQLDHKGHLVLPPKEREITLTSVLAPRLGRPATKTREASQDEPYAWESREFLRTLAIGKLVQFVIESKNPNTTREYGQVNIGGENINSLVIAAGYARVKGTTTSAEPRKSDLELIELQNAAESEKKGLWEKKDEEHVRKFTTSDPYDIYTKLRGKVQSAVVEQVRNGSLLRVTFLPSHLNVSLQLGGALAPRVPFTSEEGEPEPFAKEAKFLAERNLLHRDVQVLLTGVDKQQNFFGKVVEVSSGRSLADELISQGLAQYVEWCAPPEDKEKLLALQKAAQDKKLRIWSTKSFASAAQSAAGAPPAAATPSATLVNNNKPTSSAPAPTMPVEFMGRVREVRGGGDLVIADAQKNKFFVSISSIQVPRLGLPGKDDEPYAWEAREFLRSKIVGKKVKCVLDYNRAANAERNLTEKPFCTIFLDKTNIASALIEKGYAKVVSHRGDDPRSPHYETLVMAEMRAKKKNRGVFGNLDTAPKHHVNDLSYVAGPGRTAPENVKLVDMGKLRSFIPFLQRGGKLEAVVEHVYGGTRYKLYVPRESCVINFSLSGVKAPSKRGATEDPCAEESLEFTREQLLQQNVEIEVEALDKGGNFLGNMWHKRKNFAVTLLEEGMGALNLGPRKHLYSHEYSVAEDAAKSSRLNIWKDYDPNAKVEETAAPSEVTAKKEIYTVKIVEVLNGSQFFATKVDDIPSLDSLMSRISEANPESFAVSAPTVGSIALAKFTVDDSWYRVKVLKANKEKTQYEVAYIDYGGVESIPSTRIRCLPIGFPSPPPMAKECTLAYVKVPSLTEDFGVDAAEFLRDTIMNKSMVVNVEYREGDKLFVTLMDVEGKALINTSLVEEGLATVQKRREKHLAPLLEKMNAAQEKARRSRRNMWQYGDIASDEDE